MYSRLFILAVLCLAHPQSALVDIFRWDNGRLIPGTQGIELEPGINVSGMDLTYADFTFQDLSEGSYRSSNLTSANFEGANLAAADLTGADLTDSILQGANLQGSTLRGAIVSGTNFWISGLTQTQLAETASYAEGDLRRIRFGLGNNFFFISRGNDLTGWNFAGQDLSGADFSFTTLTDADLSGADLTHADFGISDLARTNFADATIHGTSFEFTTPRGFASEQLYETASFAAGDLRGIDLSRNNLSGWDFSDQDLTGARFASGDDFSLLGTIFTDAVVAGAIFEDKGNARDPLSRQQLYTTKSYKQRDLHGIWLRFYDLSEWDFAGQDLSHASLRGANLAGTNFVGANLQSANLSSIRPQDGRTLTGADFSGADLRRADLTNSSGSFVARNMIWPNGDIRGLILSSSNAHDTLVIRNSDLGITLHDQLTMNGGRLEFILDDAEWNSTIALDPSVAPVLGGTLRIRMRNEVTQEAFIGSTIDLFDWNGTLEPSDRFRRIELPSGKLGWDLSDLYTSGEILLTQGGLADYNANGLVDQGDLDLVLLNWGTELADAAGVGWYNEVPNGTVDQDELDKVLLDWANAAALTMVTDPAAVPEPSTGTLALAALFASFALIRRVGQRLAAAWSALRCSLLALSIEASAMEPLLRPGPFSVGYSRVAMESAGRSISIDFWYPAKDEAGPLASYAPLEDDAFAFPSDVALADPPVASGGPFPAIFFSHGSNTFSTASSDRAEALANHGFIVVAPSHTGNTIADLGVDDGPPRSTIDAWRVADMEVSLQYAIHSTQSPVLGQIDTDRLGLSGYSRGGTTALRFLTESPVVNAHTIRALLTVSLSQFSASWDSGVPTMLIAGARDHEGPDSPTAFDGMVSSEPRYLAMIEGADHFSYLDVCGRILSLNTLAAPDIVQDGYSGVAANFGTCSQEAIDNELGVDLTNSLAVAFFKTHLERDPSFVSYLTGAYWRQKELPVSLVNSFVGDYNSNGTVEQADLDLVLLNWGDELFNPFAAGWINDLPEGVIDQQELDAVLLNWGTSVAAIGAVGVPEPRSMLLLGIALALFGVRRCMKQKSTEHVP